MWRRSVYTSAARAYTIRSSLTQGSNGTTWNQLRHRVHVSNLARQGQFDIDQFAKQLEKRGFAPAQAKAIINSLDEVIEESAEHALQTLASRHEQEETITQYKNEFTELKSDIQDMERRDVDEVKEANEQLKNDIDKLRKTIQEELVRSHAGVRLDLNLEKGRIRDELVDQNDRLQKTDDKIESEIQGLKRQMEEIKWQILQYMIGTITGAGTLVLGYIHFFSQS